MVTDHLHLPYEQNEELTKNLKLEKMFRRYEKQSGLRSHVDFKNMMIKVVKNNRIAQRPLLLAVAKLDGLIRALRSYRPKLVITYPTEARFKALPRSREVQDHLSYSEAEPFPLPSAVDMLSGTASVSEADKAIIRANVAVNTKALQGYHERVKTASIGLYKDCADGLLHQKNLINLYL